MRWWCCWRLVSGLAKMYACLAHSVPRAQTTAHPRCQFAARPQVQRHLSRGCPRRQSGMSTLRARQPQLPLVIRVTLDKSPTSRGAQPDTASLPPAQGCPGIRQKVVHESILSYANVHRCRDWRLGADTNLLSYWRPFKWFYCEDIGFGAPYPSQLWPAPWSHCNAQPGNNPPKKDHWYN